MIYDHYPWLKDSWHFLLQLVKKQRIPQAIILQGTRDLSKSVLINAFEKLLLCLSPQQDQACGLCRACYLYEQQSHPDWFHLGQELEIGIDQIREINHFLSQTAHFAGRRIITLFGADKLNKYCINALLKIVEEPPNGTTFILEAEHKILSPTLSSRCMKMVIPLVTDLAKNVQTEGSKRLLQYLMGAEPIDKLLNDKELQHDIRSAPQETLYLFYYWLVDFIRYTLQGSTEFIYSSQELNKLQQVAVEISSKRALKFLTNVHEAIKISSSPGINKSLLIESLLYQWQLGDENECAKRSYRTTPST